MRISMPAARQHWRRANDMTPKTDWTTFSLRSASCPCLPFEAKGALPRWASVSAPRKSGFPAVESFQPMHRERTGEDMSAIDAGARAPETPWRDEIRAMLQLCLADDPDESRPDGDDRDRRAHDGPARPGCACRGIARRQPLFHAADLRPRADDGRLADDRHRTRPQAPFGARRAPHGAAGPVARGHGVDPDLVPALAGRGDPHSRWGRSRGWRRWPAPMCIR